MIPARIETLAQFHDVGRAGLYTQAAALAFFLGHFHPSAVWFLFAFHVRLLPRGPNENEEKSSAQGLSKLHTSALQR